MPIAWFLMLVSTVGLLFWLIVCWRYHRAMRYHVSVRSGMDLPAPEAGWERLSVVVPVHNEERVIDECAASLREQDYADLEIIFVLDPCTDRSLEILRVHADADPRVILIENDSCPDDWAGKCNAARRGADRASGKWVLFTDADTHFDPSLCRATVALAAQRDAQLVTLLSTLTCTRFHELVAQPVASMSLMHLYPIERQGRRRERPFANGQFMLFSREWYDRIGGHEAVKEALLEDLAFARRVVEHDGLTTVLLADGMLRCSMYDTLDAFTQGWRRIFIDACKRKPGRLRKHGVRLLIIGLLMPALQVAALISGVVLATGSSRNLGLALIAAVVGGWLAQAYVLGRIYHRAGVPPWAVITYPIGAWIVGKSVFIRAGRDLADRKPIAWGGREYVLEPR